MEIEVNGIRMHYGSEGEGPPVVLLHGYQLDGSFWEPQVRALKGQYRMIVPDLRGFGGSALGSVRASDMDLMAADVGALLDGIGVRAPVVLGGLSMGGYASFAFIRKYPERVRALILADTRATADTDEARRNRLELAERVEREHSSQPAIEALFERLMAPASYARQDLVVHIRAMSARTSPAGVAAALRGMAARPDSAPMLARIGCPTLIIVGERDVLTPPSDARLMHDGIKGSTLFEAPDVGHLATLEAPATVNPALIRFLERHAVGA